MRTRIGVVVLLVLAALSSAASERNERWFTSRTFLVCDESLFIACDAYPATVRLNPDYSVATEHSELGGRWQLKGRNRLTIGSREFVFSDRDQLFVSAEDDAVLFGIALVENSRAGRKALAARESRLAESPAMQRAVAHLYLRKQMYVHDTCITLTEIGDRTSIEFLVAVLPAIPADGVRAGVECTFAHCDDALSRITRKRCGGYREDWEKCLAKSDADATAQAPPH